MIKSKTKNSSNVRLMTEKDETLLPSQFIYGNHQADCKNAKRPTD